MISEITVTMESMYGCPYLCSEGKTGGNCSKCIEGYYGKDCLLCHCEYGFCNDSMAGDGSCLCEKGWTGQNCTECADCGFNTTDGKFVYDLSPLAEANFDYTWGAGGGGPVYYVNVLASTNFPCGPNPAGVCQQTAVDQVFNLGSPLNQKISEFVPPGGGVLVNYVDGDFCVLAGVNRSTTIKLVCVEDAPTKIQGVEETSTCNYVVTINSGLACPNCSKGRYGDQCKLCNCGSGGSCDEGYNGEGTCTCRNGWEPPTCSACSDEFYGPNCTACACIHGVCNSTNGSCKCPPTYNGKYCEDCQPGYYGHVCIKCQCEVHGSCNDSINGDGSCACNEGWGGVFCENCASNFYGSKCTPCKCATEHSFCLDGVDGNGDCLCSAGWEGSNCNRESVALPNLFAAGGIGIAIGVLAGLGIMGLICVVRFSKRREYQSV